MPIKSFFALRAIASIGYSTAGTARQVALAMIVVFGAIAYAYDYATFAGPKAATKDPFAVIFRCLGLLFLLFIYFDLVAFVSQVSTSLASAMSNHTDVAQLIESQADGIRKAFNPEAGDMLSLLSSFTTGIISAAVSTLSSLLAMATLQILYAVQTVLMACLVAVGPLVIAFCALPGTAGLLGRWVTALVELSAWPVLAAIIMQMLSAANVMQYYADGGTKWLELLVASILLTAAFFLIPTLVSRIVGSGFGAVGHMLSAAVTGGVATAMAAPERLGSAARRELASGARILGAAGTAASAMGGAAKSALALPPPSPPALSMPAMRAVADQHATANERRESSSAARAPFAATEAILPPFASYDAQPPMASDPMGDFFHDGQQRSGAVANFSHNNEAFGLPPPAPSKAPLTD